jgi:hypothetical protein
MVLKRHIAAMLWAAIMLVAAQLVPAVAQAHIHHHHTAAAIATPLEHGTSGVASTNANWAAAAVMTSAAWDSDGSSSSGLCKDRHSCADSCCFCPALASKPAEGLLVLPRLRDFSLPGAPARRGIDPEGLARPPRTFTYAARAVSARERRWPQRQRVFPAREGNWYVHFR